MHGVPSRSKSYMKHEVFLWTKLTVACGLKVLLQYQILSYKIFFFPYNSFKEWSPNMYQKIAFYNEWVVKRLQISLMVACFYTINHLILPRLLLCGFTTCKNLYREQTGRWKQLQVIMNIILLMTTERQIIYPCVLLFYFAALNFCLSTVTLPLVPQAGLLRWVRLCSKSTPIF